MNPEPERPADAGSVFWRVVRTITGLLLVVLGLVGLVLPILQGILFLALGLSLLAVDSPRTRQFLHWLRRKWRRKQELGG